jgi:hypothetical protein
MQAIDGSDGRCWICNRFPVRVVQFEHGIRYELCPQHESELHRHLEQMKEHGCSEPTHTVFAPAEEPES